MNKKYLLILLILVFVISGCATRTRIGAFIPAHHLSDQRSGEEVWLHVARMNSDMPDDYSKCEATEKGTPQAAPVAAAAAMFLGMGIDYLKSELQEEAKSYEASFGAKAWLTTKDFYPNSESYIKYRKAIENYNGVISETRNKGEKYDGVECKNVLARAKTAIEKSGIIVLISRWTDDPLLAPELKPEEYSAALTEIKKIVVTETNTENIPLAGSTSTFAKLGDFDNAIKGKRLAFAYAVKLLVPREPIENSPFLVQPMWKWQWLTKAKIVSLSSIQPLSWPAIIFLRTGSEVEYNVRLTIDSLVKALANNGDPSGVAQMNTVALKDAIEGPKKFDLNGGNHLIEYYKKSNVPTFGWIAIPGYPHDDNMGYFSVQLTVNESDPSNVKKTILKGSDFLEANKDNIVNTIVGK